MHALTHTHAKQPCTLRTACSSLVRLPPSILPWTILGRMPGCLMPGKAEQSQTSAWDYSRSCAAAHTRSLEGIFV
ncbi:hypothetical protein J4Q44_G00255770, partial [Coregonus suidteri]